MAAKKEVSKKEVSKKAKAIEPVVKARSARDYEIEQYMKYDRINPMVQMKNSFEAYFTSGVLHKVLLPTIKGEKKEVKFNAHFESMRVKGDDVHSMKEAWFVAYGRKALQEHLESGGYIPINQDKHRKDIKTVFYTKELRQMIHSTVRAIDVRRCYWSIAVNLGIVPESLAVYADEKGVGKEIRNVLIGSLGKRGAYLKVDKGVAVEFDSDIMSDLNLMRLDVIDYAYYELGLKVANEIGGVGMFLTDCWFVWPNKVNAIKEYLDSEGFEYTDKPVDIKTVLKMGNVLTVKWNDDMKDYVKNSEGCSSMSFGLNNMVSV